MFGNHDGLVQGNVPSLGIINAVAVGGVKVTGLPVGIDPVPLLTAVAGGNSAALATLLTAGPAKLVTPDKKRHMLNRTQTVTEYFNSTVGYPVAAAALARVALRFVAPHSLVKWRKRRASERASRRYGSIGPT